MSCLGFATTSVSEWLGRPALHPLGLAATNPNRFLERLPQILRALHANVSRFFRAGFVEGLVRDRVCEGSHGASIIDLALGALGLEIAQNARELRDLVVA